MQDGTDLPDDVEALKRLLLESRATVLSLSLEIEQLKLLLAKLRLRSAPRPSRTSRSASRCRRACPARRSCIPL